VNYDYFVVRLEEIKNKKRESRSVSYCPKHGELKPSEVKIKSYDHLVGNFLERDTSDMLLTTERVCKICESAIKEKTVIVKEGLTRIEVQELAQRLYNEFKEEYRKHGKLEEEYSDRFYYSDTEYVALTSEGVDWSEYCSYSELPPQAQKLVSVLLKFASLGIF